jgi:hypothetical protein
MTEIPQHAIESLKKSMARTQVILANGIFKNSFVNRESVMRELKRKFSSKKSGFKKRIIMSESDKRINNIYTRNWQKKLKGFDDCKKTLDEYGVDE